MADQSGGPELFTTWPAVADHHIDGSERAQLSAEIPKGKESCTVRLRKGDTVPYSTRPSVACEVPAQLPILKTEATMPSQLHRRQFIQAGTTGVLLAAAPAMSALGAESPVSTGASTETYEIKPLPFDPKAIDGFSEKILVSHYENNYAGAVKRLNAITAELANLDWAKAPNFIINGLKREELIAANSMILHEYFFAALAGKISAPDDRLAGAIKRDFGSFERWRTQFMAMGRAEGGGSGWVILTYSPRDGRLMNCWAADHTTTLADGRPVLVLDMYEHSYQMDFGAKAGAYVDAFMAAVRWDHASKLFDKYRTES